MAEHGGTDPDGPATGPAATAPASQQPYEAALSGALTAAINKLSSEILIFLLAYVILLVLLSTLGSGIPTELRALLYIIPVLGVGGYIWVRKRNVVRAAHDSAQRLRVSALSATDDAYVAGVRGSVGEAPGDVSVQSGRASGRARVIGVDTAAADGEDAADVRYLLDVARQLDPAGRRQLIARAQAMLGKQGTPGG